MDGLRIDDWACSRSFIINFHYGVIPVRRWRTPKKRKGVLSHFRKGRKTNLCCPIHIPLPYPSLPSLIATPSFQGRRRPNKTDGISFSPSLSLSPSSIPFIQYSIGLLCQLTVSEYPFHVGRTRLARRGSGRSERPTQEAVPGGVAEAWKRLRGFASLNLKMCLA